MTKLRSQDCQPSVRCQHLATVRNSSIAMAASSATVVSVDIRPVAIIVVWSRQVDLLPLIIPHRRKDSLLSSRLRRIELILLFLLAQFFSVASIWSNFAITLIKQGDQKEINSLNPNNPELYHGEWLYTIYSHVYGPVFEPVRPHVPHNGMLRYEWTGRRWICFDLVAMGLWLLTHYGIVCTFSGIHRSLGLQLPTSIPVPNQLAKLAQDYNLQLDRVEQEVKHAIDDGRLEEMITHRPSENDAASAYRIALAYTVLGDPIKATEWATQAREWAPRWNGHKQDARMVELIGHAAARVDDVSGALAAYSKASEIRGPSSQSQPGVIQLGFAYANWALKHQRAELALRALAWVRLIVSLDGTGDQLRTVATQHVELLTQYGMESQAAAVQAEYLVRRVA